MNRQLEKMVNKMREGKIVCGAVVSLTDPAVSELVAMAGYDFVWIEGEHAAYDKKDLQLHMMAAHAGDAAAMVRLTGREPGLVKPVMDMGPDIIAFPWINTAEDAREAIAACRYPPKGVRGFNPQRAGRYGQMGQANYVRCAEDETLIWMIVEQKEGFEHIEEIIKVDGVDGVVLGPGDLSVDLGSFGEYTDEVDAYMTRAAEVCRRNAMPFLAWPAMEAESMRRWAELGASMFGFSQDTHFLSKVLMSAWPAYRAGVPAEKQRG